MPHDKSALATIQGGNFEGMSFFWLHMLVTEGAEYGSENSVLET